MLPTGQKWLQLWASAKAPPTWRLHWTAQHGASAMRHSESRYTDPQHKIFRNFILRIKPKKLFLFEWCVNHWSVSDFDLFDFWWLGGQGCRGTLGGVGMSRQRRPVGKECWCPAVLILAGRKEKLWTRGERGRRAQDGNGRSWVFLDGNKKSSSHSPAPSLNFHLLPVRL